MRRMTSLRWAALGLFTAALPFAYGACDAKTEARKCQTADDCSAPYLCCIKGIILLAEDEVEVGSAETGTPRCVIPEPSLSFCDEYLPHLVETNPCGRTPIDPSSPFPPPAADQCRAGLECCPAALACQKEGSCATPAEEDPSATPSLTACSTDEECSAPELCCGISYFDRDGECMLPGACGASVDAP